MIGYKETRYPFVPITTALIIGILLGIYIPVILCLVSLVISIAISLYFWRRRPLLAQSSCLCAIVSLGALLISFRLNTPLPPHHVAHLPDRQQVQITGIVYLPPRHVGEKSISYLVAERVSVAGKESLTTGKIRVTIRGVSTPLHYGDRIRIKAKIYHPRNFGNPGAFDYRGQLRRREILLTAYVRDGSDVELISTACGNPVLRLFESWRLNISSFLDEHTTQPGRGVLKALLIGERSEIGDEVKEAFISSGAVHILAISGLHLGIIVTIIFFCIEALLRRSQWIMLNYDIRKIAALTTFPPMIAYILITGFPISTIRAGIMAACFLLSILFDRFRNPLNTLAVAAFFILVASPTSIWDVSFQLSFVSVLGIILIAPPLYRFFYPAGPLALLQRQEERGVVRWIILSFASSIAAIVCTAPVVAYHFQRLSTVALLSNCLVIPLVGFCILPIGLLSLPLIPIFPQAAAICAKGAALLSTWMIEGVDAISSLPFASLYLPGPTIPEMIAYYAIIVAFCLRPIRPVRAHLLAIGIAFFIFDGAYWVITNLSAHTLRITFLDVGQGDCALVEFPRGKRMLIDGGGLYGDFDVGEKVIARFLWKKRILSIDYLVLSHPEPDHYKGLLFITAHFRPSEFWHNGMPGEGPLYRELLDLIRKKGVRMVEVADGFSCLIDRVKIEALHPPRGSRWGEPRKRGWVNNNSLVLALTYGDHRFLFTGDIEHQGEKRLIAAKRSLKADLIKVPHHGGKSSSSEEFIRLISPRYAIISVGYANPYHLPSQEVISRYARHGCLVLRTDRDGAIKVRSDGKILIIWTYYQVVNKVHL